MRKVALVVALSLVCVGWAALPKASYAGAGAKHQSFFVPPGAWTIEFETGEPSEARIELVFGGHPDFRIQRVQAGLIDIQFADHGPHQATRYFVQNSITTWYSEDGVILIDVLNPTSREMALSVTVHGE